jgi:hypothetical protein
VKGAARSPSWTSTWTWSSWTRGTCSTGNILNKNQQELYT